MSPPPAQFLAENLRKPNPMSKSKLLELYRAVCAAVGVKKPMGKRAVERGEADAFVEDKIIIDTIRALDAMGKLK